MTRRTIADLAAGLAAVGVLALGGLIVVKPALDHFSDVYRGNPFTPRSKQETVMGEFALEVGPLKLPEVAAASKTAIGDLTAR
jgi:hypothetical protein